MAKQTQLNVGFILSRKFTLSPFALFVDTLRLASDEGDRSRRVRCDWQVMSEDGLFITSSCGIQIAPSARMLPASDFDYLVVVGGLLDRGQPVSNDVLSYLRQASAAGVTIVGVCTGSFILAEAGLMRDRTACISWLHAEEYRERFPSMPLVSDRLFILDKNILTCAGGTAAADLAASIVSSHLGSRAEKNALEILQIDRRRSGHVSQARASLAFPTATSPTVKRAVTLMQDTVASVHVV